MAKEEPIRVEGTVKEALPNAMFKVVLDEFQNREVLAYVSGRMRMHWIRILPGDRVTVEISPYDIHPDPDRPWRGRIVYRT